jgi:transcriptional regulator with XRE-family HTH domain
MATNAEDHLAILGATIRAARKARGLTQQGTAKAVGVSRAQLAGLERGANVSVKFLLKIAHFLGLSDIPLDGKVRVTSDQEGPNIAEILQALDLSDALTEYLRVALLETILPSNERVTLKETPALKEFVARHVGSAEGLARLGDAILRFSRGTASAAPPKILENESRAKEARRSRRRSE